MAVTMYTFMFQTEGMKWHYPVSGCILQMPFLALWTISEMLPFKSQQQGKIEFLGRLLPEGQLRDPNFAVILSVLNG